MAEDTTPHRKHSSGDLHSRLKTRKLLGVGETDDGDVHRSKLSQILGHSDQLYTKLPRGLRIWQFLLALMFTAIATWALFSPRSLYRVTMYVEPMEAVILPVRLYGTALLSLSLVFWSTLNVVDKELIRWSLLSSIVYFITQIIVTSMTLYELGELRGKIVSLCAHRLVFVVVSGYFYYSVAEHKPHRIRRSASAQDVASLK